MKRILFACFVFLFCGHNFLGAQENVKFTITVSTDSILLGNYFEVKFSLENANGENFQPPSFQDFVVIGGPNTASSMTMINGKVTQSKTYSYYLEPKDIGNYYIEPASIKVEDGFMETEPISIMVVPNPDGIKQQIPREPQRFEFKWDDFGVMPQLPPQQEKDSIEQTPESLDKKKKKKKKRKIYKL